jgi:hypothetical protein
MYIESPIIIVDYNHNIFIVLATVATNENLDCNMFRTKATRNSLDSQLLSSVNLGKDQTEGEGSVPLASMYQKLRSAAFSIDNFLYILYTKAPILSHVYIGDVFKAITPAAATCNSHCCTCLGHLG